MKVLLTGGTGFIGGWVAERLLERGDTVVVVDTINSYYDRSLKVATKERLTALGKDRISFHEIAVQDPALKALMEAEKPEIVCHLAAQAGVRYSIDHVMEVVQTNFVGTTNIFECARLTGVKAVVAASSSSVYGHGSTPPFDEGQRCDQPISPYAATKRAGELMAHTYSHLYKLPITNLRFFTVYGPRGRPDMAAYKFIERIERGEPIDKYGDGSAVREFTYVDDIVAGVIAAIDRCQDNGYCIANLGGGSTHTLNEFIATIEKHMGKPANINQMPDQPGDVALTSADQKEAQRLLGFKPEVSLDEGIRRTVEWYRAFKANNPAA